MSNWKPNNFPSVTSLDIPPFMGKNTSETITNIRSKQCNKENARGISICVPSVSSLDIPVPGNKLILFIEVKILTSPNFPHLFIADNTDWFSEQGSLQKSGKNQSLYWIMILTLPSIIFIIL